MPINKLLIAVALLAVLGGLVYWSNKKQEAEASKPADATPKLITLNADDVKQLEIRKKGADDTLLEKSAGSKWTMTQPKPWPVDQDAANSVVSSLSGLSYDRVVDEKASDLAQFGLTDPKVLVKAITKNGKSQTILLGDDTPTGGGVFAKAENDSRVVSLSASTKSNFDKSAQDLRDKRLLTFDSDKISRIEVNAKGQTFELGKNNQNEWQIVKPKPYRADSFQVEELIRKLKDAKMDNPGDAGKPTGFFGAPVATIRVTDASGTQQLDIRKNKDTYVGKSSVVEGVNKVANDLGDAAGKTVNDYRNKKLFEFAFNDLKKVEVRDGTATYSFQKSGDSWTSNGKQMDAVGIQSLIDKLRDLTATGFSEKTLAAPAIEVSVVTADGKKTEKVQITKDASGYFAKRENEPTVYQLSPESVSDIQRAAADVKPAPAPAAKK